MLGTGPEVPDEVRYLDLDGSTITDGGTLLGMARYCRGGAVACDPTQSPSVFRLTVTLEDWRPAVWRTVEVPATTTLADLHAVLARSFGHPNEVHEFTMVSPVGQEQCWTDHGEDQHGADETMTTVLDVVTRAGRVVWAVGPGYAEEHRIELDTVLVETSPTPRGVDSSGWRPTSTYS